MSTDYSKNTFILITGASEGIGKALAVECAKRKMNLILVALPGPELEKLADNLMTKYQISVNYFPADLLNKEAPQQLYEWVNEHGLSVNMLINNVGVGYAGRFENNTMTHIENMLQLNIWPMVTLTRLFLNDLKKHSPSYLLNVASLASFRPVPYKSIYAATKSFIYSFTRALKVELKDTRVKVSVLCPGSVYTNHRVITRIEGAGFLSKISAMNPDDVASFAIKKLLKGKAVIIPGRINRIYKNITLFLPKGLFLKISEKLLRQEA